MLVSESSPLYLSCSLADLLPFISFFSWRPSSISFHHRVKYGVYVSGFITVIQRKRRISANGNLSNCSGKHACTLRFRNCGSAETHSLNSPIRNVYAVTETLIAIVFPRLVNSTCTDTQLSAGFLESKCNDKLRIRKVYAGTKTLIAVMFPRFVNLTDTQLSAGFRRVTS